MFQRLFGGGKKDPQVSTNHTLDALQKLNEQEEMAEKRRDVLDKQIAAQIEKAKECLKKGNKPAAQLALKRKAMLVKQVEIIENNIMRLNEQRMLLEEAVGTAQTVAALQAGAKAHKATMAQFNVQSVDKVMDEIQEAAEQAQEVQQALAQPLGQAAYIEDDDLEAELAELEGQQMQEEMLAPARVPATHEDELELPDVPTGLPMVPAKRPAGAVKTTEDELAELEAELAAS